MDFNKKLQETVKSIEDLSRHQNSKNRKIQLEQGDISTSTIAGNCLNPECFTDYINNCAKQIASGACYSDDTIVAFNSYECFLDNAVYIFKFVRDATEILDSDDEKFYS